MSQPNPAPGRLFAATGRVVWFQAFKLVEAAAMIGLVISSIFSIRTWLAPRRKLLLHQLGIMAIEPLFFVGAVAALVGISVLVQLSHWTAQTGQSQLLGPLAVTIVARELAPVLINFIVIIRNGSAMTTELGVQKISGEFTAGAAETGDLLARVVVPRVLGMAIATFCLTFVFTGVALASGFVCAAFIGKGSSNLFAFVDSILGAIQADEVLNIIAKSVLPALFAAASCCIEGMSVSGSFAAIPQATQQALTRSIAGLFFICSTVTLLTWL